MSKLKGTLIIGEKHTPEMNTEKYPQELKGTLLNNLIFESQESMMKVCVTGRIFESEDYCYTIKSINTKKSIVIVTEKANKKNVDGAKGTQSFSPYKLREYYKEKKISFR